jgi:heterodisulfide reductase subunit B
LISNVKKASLASCFHSTTKKKKKKKNIHTHTHTPCSFGKLSFDTGQTMNPDFKQSGYTSKQNKTKSFLPLQADNQVLHHFYW